MTHRIDLSLQKPLEDYISLLEKIGLRSMGLMAEMVAYDVRFSDPVHEVRGWGGVDALWTRRFKAAENLRYRVTDFAWMRREKTAMIGFVMEGKRKKRQGLRSGYADIEIAGAAEVIFTPEGKIASVQEFWGKVKDGFGQEYDHPIIGGLS